MTQRITARIKPEILVWARKSAGYRTVEVAAAALKVNANKLDDWEHGKSVSLSQLRDLARLYKRPLAVFYLQEVPRDFMALSDLRRHPENQGRGLSPELVQEMRAAQQRRELALELADDLDANLAAFDLRIARSDDPDLVGEEVRNFLGIQLKHLSRGISGADGRKAFNFWRQRIESRGVLVFQMTKVDSKEASGFAVASNLLPIIGINRKDPPTRRLFSLLHEFVHIAVGKSGVSDLDMDFAQVTDDDGLEAFCNRVAAASLVPKDVLLADPLVEQHRNEKADWNDAELAHLARRFGVSREALLLRLVSFRRASWKFFKEKRDQWNAEYRDRERALAELNTKAKARSIRRDMPQEALSNLGRLFLGLVIGNYHQDRITLSEVSGYIGIKARHVRRLETKLGVLM